MFNREQQEHMEYLATVPREWRCASGWHVVSGPHPDLIPCDCGPYKPPATPPGTGEVGEE
jgi:hypothetical protein